MNIPLRVMDPPFPEEREAGMMWRGHPDEDEDGRECWWVELPHDHPDIGTPGNPSRLSWRTTDRASAEPHEMWEVTGTPPNITVHPSIDVLRFVKGPPGPDGKPTWVRDGSYWHGWIIDGELRS